jgi:DNA ligase-associated metallophosphoesterase
MRSDRPMDVFPGSMAIRLGGVPLQLLPDRAIWWPARQTLVVADVHLGKGAAFRKAGLPVPAGSSEKNLRRLDALLAMTAAQRLVVLGDLVHARSSHDAGLLDAVTRWREARAEVAMLLIRGNHDRSAGRVPAAWSTVEQEEPFEEGELTFSHQPRCDLPAPVLAGHIHPVVSLRDFDRSTLRVPCFVIESDRCLTLPAFGAFTGGFAMKRAEGQRLYVTSGKKVICVM